jgi:hypothetical protein
MDCAHVPHSYGTLINHTPWLCVVLSVVCSVSVVATALSSAAASTESCAAATAASCFATDSSSCSASWLAFRRNGIERIEGQIVFLLWFAAAKLEHPRCKSRISCGYVLPATVQ